LKKLFLSGEAQKSQDAALLQETLILNKPGYGTQP